jgi:hypothetical protein
MNSSNICTACDLAVNAAGTGCLTVPQITKADVASSLVAESLGNTSIQYSGSGNSTLPGGACKTGTLQPGIYRVVLGGGSGGDDYGNGPKGGKLTYNFMLKNPTAYRLCAGSDGNWRVGCGETGGGAGSYLKLTMNATDYYFAGGGGSGKDGSYGGGGGGGIGSGGACWKCSISGSGGVDGWGGVNSIGAIYSKNPSYNYSAANGGNGLDNNNGTPGFVQYCGGGGGGGGDASKGAGQDICLSYSSKRECTDGGSSCSDDSKTTIYTCTGAWIKSGRGSNITLHRLNQNGDAMADFTGRLGGSGGQAGKTTHDTNVSDPEPCDRCAKIFKFNI